MPNPSFRYLTGYDFKPNIDDINRENRMAIRYLAIAGIPVSVCYPGSDKTYDFVTSAEGIVYSGTSAGRENYGCIMNVISSAGAHGITIEGIGKNAVFFQFGIYRS